MLRLTRLTMAAGLPVIVGLASCAQTITICKTATPSNGTTFPFTWVNGGVAQPPFPPLTDGACQVYNVTAIDKYNTFAEAVVPGWTLTNIACTGATRSAISVIGANPNPAFQPGDHTVTIDLADPNVTCTFHNSIQCAGPPAC